MINQEALKLKINVRVCPTITYPLNIIGTQLDHGRQMVSTILYKSLIEYARLQATLYVQKSIKFDDECFFDRLQM